MCATYQLSYRTYGTGKNVYLAFHGFGQSKMVFQAFHEILPDSQIIAFDLFFHGSQLDAQCTVLTPTDWKKMLLTFLQQHQIDRFGLIGFSMGGKVALQTILLFPDQIADVILIAPDGLQSTNLYKVVTQFSPMRAFFKRIMAKESPTFGIMLNTLQQMGAIDKSSLKMYYSQTKTQVLRDRLYGAWILYRKFLPNTELIIKYLNQDQIHTRIFIGKYDRLIPEKHVRKITPHLENYTLEILESGHYNLVNATFKFIKSKTMQ